MRNLNYIMWGGVLMEIYIVICTFNAGQTLVAGAFRDLDAAKAYVAALNGDKARAIARCKEVISQLEGGETVKFLVEESPITFDIVVSELK